jgi:hypothetical protein
MTRLVCAPCGTIGTPGQRFPHREGCGNDRASNSHRARRELRPCLVTRPSTSEPGRPFRQAARALWKSMKGRGAARQSGSSFGGRCPPETAASSSPRVRKGAFRAQPQADDSIPPEETPKPTESPRILDKNEDIKRLADRGLVSGGNQSHTPIGSHWGRPNDRTENYSVLISRR